MLVYVFIVGLIFGSFLNALVYRLHKKKSLWTRSACPKCEKEIVWYDNIPVFSFLWLKGKCRNCHNKISWQYPLVELSLGILFLIPTLFISYPDLKILVSLIVQWLIIFDLAFIFLYDFKYQEILDISIWPLAIFLFDVNYFFNVFSIVNMLIAVLVGGGFFLLQYLISRGRWIGGGDIILGVLMGVILGWSNILLALFVAYILGGIIGAILLLLKKKQVNSEIPFGTFLVIGTLIAMWWGNRIVEWYVSLLR